MIYLIFQATFYTLISHTLTSISIYRKENTVCNEESLLS